MVKDTHFYCHGETLEITKSQTYPGLVFTPSGKFWLARETLSKKGQKGLGYIKCLLSNSDNLPCKLQLKLFDTLLKPILLYGSEIWGPELLSLKTDFNKGAPKIF